MILQDGGKTDGRLIPLPDNACAWLLAYAPQDGPMWTMSIDAMNAHLRRLVKRCGMVWRANALRKSGQTYDLLRDASYERVSTEAGNSPRMMRHHYVDPKLANKTDAQAWFGIMPPVQPRVIVPLEQQA